MINAVYDGLKGISVITSILLLMAVHFESIYAQTTEQEQSNQANRDENSARFKGMSRQELMSQIVALCPTPDKELSEECEDALDAYFLSEPIVRSFDPAQYDDWLDFGEPLTFSQVFSNIHNDVDLVLDALTRKECRLNEGDRINVELNEECHAEAFRNVYFLQVNCGFSSRSFGEIQRSMFSRGGGSERGSRQRGARGNRQPTSEFVAYVDNQIRERQRSETDMSPEEIDSIRHHWWESYLKPKWVLNQCQELDFNAINSYPSEHGQDVYASISARLGDRYSMVAYKFFDATSAFNRWLERNYRWLSEYRELTREYPIVEPRDAKNLFNFAMKTYRERLVSHFTAMKGMNELGWGYNFDKIVSKFCTTPFVVRRQNDENSVIEWPGDCSWLTFGLHSSLKDPQLLALLEEFEKKAKEQDVFVFVKSSIPNLADRAFSAPNMEIDQGLKRVLSPAPVYPREAMMDGTEGWVIVKFNVLHDGSVDNVRVDEAEPKRTFNQAAIDVASMFRYLPLVKENKPHMVKGVKSKIVFQLE